MPAPLVLGLPNVDLPSAGGRVSSSTLNLEGGLSDNLDGGFKGLRGKLLEPPGPRELADVGFAIVADGLRMAAKFNLAGGALRGDSGRGKDGRRTRGRGIEGGPTDLLKFVEADGRDGVGGVTTFLLVTYFELFIGTKMPAPAMFVVK